jgi:alpha-1,3-rhamnosyl/mannosyltransferase
VELRRLRHAASRAGTGGGAARRIGAGLARELVYYPLVAGGRARRLGAQLLHASGPFWPRARGIPLVLTLHDALPWRFPELFTRLNVLQQRTVVAAAARRAARVLVGSEHTARELTELVGVAPQRIVVTPYGVDPRFRPTARDPAWLERRFGIRGPYVLAVGTLEPRKNLGTLLRAFARVRGQDAQHALVLVGGRGWRDAPLERALAGAGAGVVRAGRVSDDELVRLYGSAACFAFPSRYEGFGLPVLEAMACGAPVVAGDRTSLPEVVGDAGLLVDPDDEEALASALRRVLTDPELAADLRQRGLARSAAFSWDRCAELTVAVYRAALAERP